MRNALTVDVEDYFHPTEIQRRIGPSEWRGLPSRVERATAEVLALLDSRQVRATFFILGWVAERFPGLARTIATAGHEIACHSYAHQLVFELSPEAFRADTERAKQAIEDACGVSPRAYRAPSYSITRNCMWALDILGELGFTIDSSIYPIHHDRYGIPGFSRHAVTLETASGRLLEIPPATVQLSPSRIAPVGGGGYLRLLPLRYTAAGIRRINAEERQPACIYFHPWEIDTGQPKLASGWIARARTYAGVPGMRRKLLGLMDQFEFSTISTVYGK